MKSPVFSLDAAQRRVERKSSRPPFFASNFRCYPHHADRAVDKNLKTIIGGRRKRPTISTLPAGQSQSIKEDLQSDPLGVAERFGVLPISSGSAA